MPCLNRITGCLLVCLKASGYTPIKQLSPSDMINIFLALNMINVSPTSNMANMHLTSNIANISNIINRTNILFALNMANTSLACLRRYIIAKIKHGKYLPNIKHGNYLLSIKYNKFIYVEYSTFLFKRYSFPERWLTWSLNLYVVDVMQELTMWNISVYKVCSRVNIYICMKRYLLLTLTCDKCNYYSSQDHNGVYLTQ